MAELKLDTAQNRVFLMVLASDGVTGATGLTITAQISKNGGPLSTPEGVVTEIGSGFYNIALTVDDTNTPGDLGFNFTAAGADPQSFVDQVVENPEIFNVLIPGPLSSNQYANRLIAQWYFNQRLNSNAWNYATPSDQDTALTQATRQIDQLNYIGYKTSKTQPLQFPRTGDTAVPTEIVYATCELALVLLEDVDINQEMKSVNMQENKFGNIITRRDTSFVPDWQLAGIPSPLAWNYLKPYLRDPYEIEVSRKN